MVKKTIIPATKKLGKELIKEASPEHKLRVCAYVRVSPDSEEQLESFKTKNNLLCLDLSDGSNSE